MTRVDKFMGIKIVDFRSANICRRGDNHTYYTQPRSSQLGQRCSAHSVWDSYIVLL